MFPRSFPGGSCLKRLAIGVVATGAVLATALPAASFAAPTVVSLGFDDGQGDTYAACDMLAQRGLKATFFVTSGFVGEPNRLTWEQVANLAADGNEIGGHTLDHPNLNNISPEEQRRQICDDRAALLKRGLSPTSFAYPYGAYQLSTMEIVRACGYNSAGRRGASTRCRSGRLCRRGTPTRPAPYSRSTRPRPWRTCRATSPGPRRTEAVGSS